jgi:hypothetical protein
LKASKDILKTLCYFDLFHYPLKRKEIYSFLPRIYKKDEFEIAIKELINSLLIFEIEDFLSLEDNLSLSERRKKGNTKAANLLKVAERIAVFLSWFPYVKGVAVSGSLSKNYAADKDDIDWFIITKSNRLWIARTILLSFKKLASLLGQQRFFCMNYFIDEQALEIPEKTLYSAIEIKTLLPLYGSTMFEKFFQANEWATEALPSTKTNAGNRKKRGSAFKWVMEHLLNNSLGNKLDNLLLHATLKRLKKKEHALQKEIIRGLLIGEKHVARHNPEVFQKELMIRYELKVAEVLERYNTIHNTAVAS